MYILHNTHTYIVLGDLCDNIGLVGVSAMWSSVTTSPSHHDQAIPILSPLLFMHVGHPYLPLFIIRRIFDLLVLHSIYIHVGIVHAHTRCTCIIQHGCKVSAIDYLACQLLS